MKKSMVCNHSNEGHRAVFLCGTITPLYRVVVIIFESVDEILVCDHSNERYWSILSFCTISFFTVFKKNVFNLAFPVNLSDHTISFHSFADNLSEVLLV